MRYLFVMLVTAVCFPFLSPEIEMAEKKESL